MSDLGLVTLLVAVGMILCPLRLRLGPLDGGHTMLTRRSGLD